MKKVQRMTGNLRQSVSCPEKIDQISTNITLPKSFSESYLNELLDGVCLPENQVEIIFEGDGPLGILFIEQYNDAVVCGINSRTVASEEIDLTIGLKLIKIEEYKCEHISYKDIMDLVCFRWNKYSKLKLRFEKIVEPLTKCPVYQLLETVNCEKYYDCFLELGAKTLEDLNFVEYQDLINMKMTTIQRRHFNKVINLNHIEPTHLLKSPTIFRDPIEISEEGPDNYEDLIADDV